MPGVNKTLENPRGLTGKQLLTAQIIAQDIKDGNGVKLSEAHERVYPVKNRNTASAVATSNIHKVNFRDEIIAYLVKMKVLGVNGKLQRRLSQGLDAKLVGSGKPAYTIILAYIKEINKVLGTYAPVKVDQRTLNLRSTMTPKELHANIEGLEQEVK